jgi:Acyl-CoA dehydrogenase, C-terminal domain
MRRARRPASSTPGRWRGGVRYRRRRRGRRDAPSTRTELARTKTPVASSGLLKERASAQLRLGRAEAILGSGCLLLLDTLSEAWRRCVDGETHSLEQKADLLLAMAHAMSSAVQAVELACSIAGTTAFRASSLLERGSRAGHVGAAPPAWFILTILTLMMQQVLTRPHWAERLTATDLRSVTLLIWEHVNPYRRFELDMETRLDLSPNGPRGDTTVERTSICL